MTVHLLVLAWNYRFFDSETFSRVLAIFYFPSNRRREELDVSVVLLGAGLEDIVGAGQHHIRTDQAASPDDHAIDGYSADHHSHSAEGVLVGYFFEVIGVFLLLPE